MGQRDLTPVAALDEDEKCWWLGGVLFGIGSATFLVSCERERQRSERCHSSESPEPLKMLSIRHWPRHLKRTKLCF